MIKPSLRWLALGAVALLAACGEDPAATGTIDAGPVVKVLVRAGPGAIEAHPGDQLTLQAVLAVSDVGPVPDATVTWKIVTNPGGAELSTATSTTNEAGVAETVLQLDPTEIGEYVVRADSAGATSKAVWKIDVQNPIKHLRILPATGIVTDNADQHANVSAGIGRQVVLRVAATVEERDGDRKLAGEPVTFAFTGGQYSGATFPNNADGKVTTQADGTASIALAAGTAAGNFSLSATIAGGISVTFDVTVSRNGGAGCQSSTQCPSGQSCISGQCQAVGSGSADCSGNDRPCPVGFSCNATSGQCEPGSGGGCEACPKGPACTSQSTCTGGQVCTEGFCQNPGVHCDESTNTCVPDDPCSSDTDCPSGFTCQSGVCNPSGDAVIDVTGLWFTRHYFDINAALPGWVRTIKTVVNTMDQVANGQIPNLPSIVNALISGVIRQYIPEWVLTLIRILNSVLTVFSDLRAEGQMDLVANGGPRILAGNEVWDRFVFRFLPACGASLPTPTNPCDVIDIYTTDLEAADLAVSVMPFAAKVGGDSTSGYTLLVDPRQAKMKIAGLLKYVLDQAISATTPYPSLEDRPCSATVTDQCGPGSGALSNLIDCAGLNEFINQTIPFDITGLCQAAVSAGGSALANVIRNITISQDVLNFSGQATARATAGNALYADELGWPDYRTRKDGEWKGKFHILVDVKNVPGAWRGSRIPFADNP
jgi:Cys-rich repeat protein